MTWEKRERRGSVREWVRADGAATIRLRERDDGSVVVRLDRLHQAPEGTAYRRERVADAAAARDLVDAWKADYDEA